MLVALTALAATRVNAECASACSGHGTCGARDACSCYKNWMGNDCSLRICPFAHAFVDSPKGDLDMTGGALRGSSFLVATGDEVYPEGTTEQYPNADSNEGHFYMECANKGLCNRKSGDCECFDGYEGTACARTVCPNTCSGHGTCETIQELAEMGTFDTTAGHVASTTGFTYSYNLWDQEKSVGCKCDEGFYGADCSLKKCKYGVDPLFESEGQRIAAEFQVKTDASSGTFKLKMYDVYGEDYITADIAITATADEFCEAIDILPNGVFDMDRTSDHNLDTHYTDIESDDTYYTCDTDHVHSEACCGRNADGDFYMYLHNNPGPLKTPEFFSSDPTASKLVGDTYSVVSHISFVPGEFVDYFGKKMVLASQVLPGAQAPIATISGSDLTCADTATCASQVTALGITFPALMKLKNEVYVVASHASGVFTTLEAHAAQTNVLTTANALAAPYIYFASATLTEIAEPLAAHTVTAPVNTAPNTWTFVKTDGTNGLNKEDTFIFLDIVYTIYAVTETEATGTYTAVVTTTENYLLNGATNSGTAYKVTFDTSVDNFEYTTQCSNRGVCEESTGLCKCFKGYSNDNCDTQNAYAL